MKGLNYVVTKHGRDFQTFIFVRHLNISVGEKSVILFKQSAYFQQGQVFETGLCEFHRNDCSRIQNGISRENRN